VTTTDGHVRGEHFVALQRALAGQFSIEHLLGRGGMGLVYLAREVRLDRLVALKVLPPELHDDAGVRERFLRESRIAAQLSHPNIVPIFRVDEVAGFVFFVMQYVDGPTLAARIRHHGALEPSEVARVVRDVAWALAYAHARGVVHRDIKPENILIDRETGRALVTDFGIAQRLHYPRLSDDEDGSGVVVGSVHFMSPEQAGGAPADGRSDLYSLGMVAWHALAGRVAFDGRTSEVLERQRREDPPPITSVNPRVPPALADVVHRALAKNPQDRYPTAESFAEAIALSVAPELVIDIPLRLWLLSGDELRYVLAATLGLGGLSLARNAGKTGNTVLGGMGAYLVSAVFAYVLLELAEVRRLMAAGYSIEALRAALRAFTGRAEGAEAGALAAAMSARRRGLARAFGFGAFLAAAVMVIAIAIREHRVSAEALGMLSIGLVGLAVGSGDATARGRMTALRARLWHSRTGDLLARLLTTGLTKRADGSLPDKTIVSESAEDFLHRENNRLFATLPAGAQRDLSNLPGIVTELDKRANELRRRITDLERSLTMLQDGERAARSSNASNDSDRQSAITDVRAEHDAAGAQLREVVTQLEEIRLELLTLRDHAGALAPLVATLGAVEPAPVKGTSGQTRHTV
jgi:serine/threonine-protein kinase